MTLLKVTDLKVWDCQSDKMLVQKSSFDVDKKSCLAIVGESGSGKSITCRAIMRLNKATLKQSGEIWLNGENLQTLTDKQMRKKRGKNLCMIMQNGMRAFDPTSVIGVHLRETVREHFGWTRNEIEAKVKDAMQSVMLRNAGDLLNMYPHQLSGGMLQRIMIALAIVLEPDVLIADEPTTALDSISRYEVVEQFVALRERIGSAMIIVSHDLGVVKKIADHAIVMKNGIVVERGTIESIFTEATHAYTQQLVATTAALHEHFHKMARRHAMC